MTDEQRDEAAMMCAMMASSNWQHTREAAIYMGDIYDYRTPTGDIAREALWATPPNECSRTRWAEAEALLRDGWSPGEPVTLKERP